MIVIQGFVINPPDDGGFTTFRIVRLEFNLLPSIVEFLSTREVIEGNRGRGLGLIRFMK
jgi:hypothetical protein